MKFFGRSQSGVHPELSKKLEPCASKPKQKLNTIEKFKDAGIPVGMFLMPIIPFLIDREESIEASIAAAKSTGVDYNIYVVI